MSEAAFSRKVDDVIDQWREAGTTNPVLNRLRHMSNAEVEQAIEGNARAEQFYRDEKHACHCYPTGFISTPRAVKEQLKAEHIAKGEHETWCPCFKGKRDYDPWNFGLTAPSYTAASARREQDAMNEAVQQMDR